MLHAGTNTSPIPANPFGPSCRHSSGSPAFKSSRHFSMFILQLLSSLNPSAPTPRSRLAGVLISGVHPQTPFALFVSNLELCLSLLKLFTDHIGSQPLQETNLLAPVLTGSPPCWNHTHPLLYPITCFLPLSHPAQYHCYAGSTSAPLPLPLSPLLFALLWPADLDSLPSQVGKWLSCVLLQPSF